MARCRRSARRWQGVLSLEHNGTLHALYTNSQQVSRARKRGWHPLLRVALRLAASCCCCCPWQATRRDGVDADGLTDVKHCRSPVSQQGGRKHDERGIREVYGVLSLMYLRPSS